MLLLDRSNVLNDDECGIIDFKVQLQLRLCLCETSSEQSDVFPSSVSISVNGSTCLLQVGSANLQSLSENVVYGSNSYQTIDIFLPRVNVDTRYLTICINCVCTEDVDTLSLMRIL